MSERKPHIDVVLPCYNPIPGWQDTLIERFRALQEALPGYELTCTLVNDGSSQGVTDELVGQIQIALGDLQWLSYPVNKGKGYALRYGIERCKGPFLLYTDVDFPYSIESMVRCARSVTEDGFQLAMAVRNASYYSKLPRGRRMISKALKSMNSTLLGIQTSDTQGGLKAFDLEARGVFLQTQIHRYLFDLEFVYLMSKDEDMAIKEVGAQLREDVAFTSVRSGILLREGLNFLKVLLRRPKSV